MSIVYIKQIKDRGSLMPMNEYMNRISFEVFSYFGTGKRKSKKLCI